MKALIINDTTNWYHFGCTATSTVLKQEISKLGYEVTSFSILDGNSLKSTPDSVLNFFDEETLSNFIATNAAFCTLIKEHEIIVANGEGTMHGPKKGPITLLYMLYLAKNIFGKKVQIINHSVYPLDSLLIEDNPVTSLYKKIYTSMNFVAIREPLSLSVMHNLGIKAQESFDCLPLYIRYYYPSNTYGRQDKLILLSGSAA